MARSTRTSSRAETEDMESGTPEAQDEHAHQGSDATADGVVSSPVEGRPAIHPAGPASEARVVHEALVGGHPVRVIRDGRKVFIHGLGAGHIEVTSEAMAIAHVDRIAAGARA